MNMLIREWTTPNYGSKTNEWRGFNIAYYRWDHFTADKIRYLKDEANTNSKMCGTSSSIGKIFINNSIDCCSNY